jgi:hypothetical protein
MPGNVDLLPPATYTQPPTTIAEEDELLSIISHEAKLRQHADSIRPIKPDTISSFEEDETKQKEQVLYLKKFTLSNAADASGAVWPGTPTLAHPQAIIASTSAAQIRIGSMAAQLSQTQAAPSATPKQLNETSQMEVVKSEDTHLKIDNDSQMDREVLDRANALRSSKNESVATTYKEIDTQLKYRKAMFEERKALDRYIDQRSKISKKLDWVKGGATLGLVAFSVAGFAITLATAGIGGAVFGVLAAVAGAAQGVTQVSQSIIQMQQQEKQGLAAELNDLRDLAYEQVQKLLDRNQIEVQKITELWKLASDLLRVQSESRIIN